jgi:hypothetical protein
MENQKQRTTLVTVLCIINWVFAGCGFFGFLLMFFIANPINHAMRKMESAVNSNYKTVTSDTLFRDSSNSLGQDSIIYMANDLEKMVNENLKVSMMAMDNMKLFAGIGLVACFILILGSIEIYRLRSQGLPIYIVGCIVMIGGYFYSYWPVLMSHSIMAIGYWFSGIFTAVIFIAMASLFTWQMRKANINA